MHGYADVWRDACNTDTRVQTTRPKDVCAPHTHTHRGPANAPHKRPFKGAGGLKQYLLDLDVRAPRFFKLAPAQRHTARHGGTRLVVSTLCVPVPVRTQQPPSFSFCASTASASGRELWGRDRPEAVLFLVQLLDEVQGLLQVVDARRRHDGADCGPRGEPGAGPRVLPCCAPRLVQRSGNNYVSERRPCPSVVAQGATRGRVAAMATCASCPQVWNGHARGQEVWRRVENGR